jgi:hypothetical protein
MNQMHHPGENAPPNGHGRTDASALLPLACPLSPPEPDDPRVIQALDAYLGALEEGCKLDRDTFLAEHAEIAEALAKCLDGLEFVQTI